MSSNFPRGIKTFTGFLKVAFTSVKPQIYSQNWMSLA